MIHHLIYDQSDPDGYMSAVIAGQAIRGSCEFHPWHRGMKTIKFDFDPKVDMIYMMDMSLEKEAMIALADLLRERFVWIDHHKNDIQKIRPHIAHAKTYTYHTHSTMELAWDYFFPDKEMPPIVQYLGYYDCRVHDATSRPKPDGHTWTNIVLPLQAYYGSYLEDYHLYASALAISTDDQAFLRVLHGGHAMLDFERGQFAWAARHLISGEFFGQPVVAINATLNPSRFKEYLEVPTLLVYYLVGVKDDGSPIWKYSFRSDDPTDHLAEMYGGGGHALANGFVHHLPLTQISDFVLYEKNQV